MQQVQLNYATSTTKYGISLRLRAEIWNSDAGCCGDGI